MEIVNGFARSVKKNMKNERDYTLIIILVISIIFSYLMIYAIPDLVVSILK